MTEQERYALVNFMLNTLNTIFPNHLEFPYDEIKEIDMYEGEESEKLNKYHIDHLRAYYKKKDISIIQGGDAWLYHIRPGVLPRSVFKF